MKVQCKHIAIDKKFCGKFGTCWHTKLCIKLNHQGTYTYASDCRTVLDLDWIDYLLYKDYVVEVKEDDQVWRPIE